MLRVFCPTLYLEMYVSRPGCLLVIKTITEISLSARSAVCLRENLMFWVRGQKRAGLIISLFLLFSFTWLKFTYCSLENICKYNIANIFQFTFYYRRKKSRNNYQLFLYTFIRLKISTVWLNIEKSTTLKNHTHNNNCRNLQEKTDINKTRPRSSIANFVYR